MTWTPATNTLPLPIEVGGTNSLEVVTNPTATSWAGWDGNKNFSANNFSANLSKIVTSNGTTALTVASTQIQIFIGVAGQNVILPDVSTLEEGQVYNIVNRSTGQIVVYTFDGDLLQTLDSQSNMTCLCVSTIAPDINAWAKFYIVNADASGSVLLSPSSNQQIQNYPLEAPNFISGYATTATAAGTTTLIVASKYQQYFTGSTTQTVVMPVTSTLVTGQSWLIVNNSSGNLTVNASDSSLILTMTPNTQAVITCISTSVTSNAGWNNQYVLNQLTPSANNVGVVLTGFVGDAAAYFFNYISGYIFNTYYANLISMSQASTQLIGPTTINFGNVGWIASTLNVGNRSTTSIIGNSVLFINQLSINLPLLTTFQFNNVVDISGASTFTNINSLVTLSLPSVVLFSPTFTSATSLATINLPAWVYDYAALSGTLNALTTFTAPNLTIIAGNYSLTTNSLTTLSLPALINIGSVASSLTGNFAPVSTSLTTVNLPALVTVNGTFSPTLAALTSLTLTNLQTVTGAFGLTAASLTTLSMPALTTLGAGFAPVCAAATTVTLTLLSSITGAVAASFASLTTLSLPALTTVTSTFTITAANLVTFSMNTGLLNIGGNFTMTGMKLDQTSVDGILVRLAALDGTGGTTSYNNRTVNLSGGTSSAPSATGLTAKATLQARGCTVTTN